MRILFALIAVCGALDAFGDFIVAPTDRAAQNGNNGLSVGFSSPADFQMVYTAKSFPKPVLITGIAFRQDEQLAGLSVDAVIPRVAINMTTFAGTANSFNSAAYSANRAIDDTLVFDGNVTWHTVGMFPGPSPFDLAIHFSQPFAYDPAKGSLLMHYVVPQNTTIGLRADFDGHNDPSIGWYGTTGFPNSLSFGDLVAQFEVTDIPEPSSLRYLICAFFVFSVPSVLSVARKSRLSPKKSILSILSISNF